MTIRHYLPADREQVSQFWINIWQEMGWDDAIEGIEDIAGFLHFPEGFLLVIEEANEILACAGVKPIANSIGIMKRFYLAKQLRGKGVSEKLLTSLIEESQKRQISTLVLDVYYTNLRAKHFYEKHGFTQYAQEPINEWDESKFPKEFFYYKLKIA